jgi:hypothetical protein
MQQAQSSPSRLVRIFDNFLQERSIRWLLALGVLILLGSSLLLVTLQWDNTGPVWKYSIFFGYTAALFVTGEWTYYRLALRRTGTVLQALTVLLVPILFLSLDWGLVPAESPLHASVTVMDVATRLVLGALTLAFAVYAVGRILRHFLRGSQPTFLASYHLLAVAGAVLPWLPSGWRPAAALALWAVFAAGTMKVNRHVFWLTEEHRKPRIFGFFPMALLGAQFLTLFLLFAASHVGLDMLGIGAVLVAIPVLAAGDAWARVVEQRSGGLLRPLPWSVLVPLGIGLTLTAAGVILAATGLAAPPHRGHALVIAAGIAAGMMMLVARRTRKTAFVWAMLLALTLTYQFSPAFFIDVVKALASRGAELVREERLPFAFYGLTYLPLVAALMASSAWLAPRSPLFARPMRRYCIGIACVLLALSITHPKAMSPVGLVMTLVFAIQVALFRKRWLAAVAALAWMLAAFGVTDFLERILGFALPAGFRLGSLTLAVGALSVAGYWCDPALARLSPSRAFVAGPLQLLSFLIAIGLTCCWMSQAILMPESSSLATGMLLALVLLYNAILHRRTNAIALPSLIVLNWQLLAAAFSLLEPNWVFLFEVHAMELRHVLLPGAFLAAASAVLWQSFGPELASPWNYALRAQVAALRLTMALGLAFTLDMVPSLTPIDVLLVVGAFGLAMFAEGMSACRAQSESRAWVVIGLGIAGAAYLAWFRVLALGSGAGMFMVLGVTAALWLAREATARHSALAVLARPCAWTALALPAVAVALGVYRHFTRHHPTWLGVNSLALLLAGGIYFWRGIEDRSKRLLLASGVILNVALALLCRELAWSDPQCFMIPIGITILAFVQLLKDELPETAHDPLRYLAALVILVSPIFNMVHGWNWLHFLTLMLASVGVVIVAIGVRVRALMYTGTAFLLADLVAVVVRGSFDDANVLWIAGLALGSAVLVLGAACERNREAVLQRMRVVAEALRQWE